MISEGLADKRILVTGVTGFIGQALLERLLSEFPSTRLVLLVRPRATMTGRDRIERILARPLFKDWRERAGEAGVERAFSERVEVLEGDVPDRIPPLPSDLDLVFHCAATVRFDPPVDEAFRINLRGTTGVLEALHAAGARPHVVHVSTAYVAGNRRGVVAEATLPHRVDWRAEAEWALSARREVEYESRTPERLEGFLAAAASEHGRTGPRAVAEDAEARRARWVDERLSDNGRARAQTLGWPDVYTFSKALGERAAEGLREDIALSIVRPSIVESAYGHPYPGWIHGMKMAEPIILAFGRGVITEFPGIPDGVVDIIPVDLVVNAMLAVAASPPSPSSVGYFHVSSGCRNPLTYRLLYELVREHFEEHPLLEGNRGAIKVPEWTFPGRARVDRMLRVGERATDIADRVVSHLPRAHLTREAARRIDEQRESLKFVRRYADLYAAYAEAEVIYTDDCTARLHASLPEEDRARFGFDSAQIDWRYYLKDVHCPSVTRGMRRSVRQRSGTPGVELTSGDGIVAVFDMEDTILDSNVVEAYVWTRLADDRGPGFVREMLALGRALPRYVSAERRDRGEFLRQFYRRYEGASVEGLARLVEEDLAGLILRRAAPDAIRRVREHRFAGHRTILITGALRPLTIPLAPLF
ncbi:MAG: SDR family oxidoreductase, partial [Actinomycetota bacterium]